MLQPCDDPVLVVTLSDAILDDIAERAEFHLLA